MNSFKEAISFLNGVRCNLTLDIQKDLQTTSREWDELIAFLKEKRRLEDEAFSSEHRKWADSVEM